MRLRLLAGALTLLHRELLVAGRQRSTFVLRAVMALGSTLLGGLLLWSISEGGPTGAGWRPGQTLFYMLAWLGLATAGLSGVFFAADAISAERRDGTLGLLFLTELRGRDVVLGKLSTTTLRSTFTLMATLPVIALPLLMGGVTFRSYGLSAAVLANTIFLSASSGLAVSSFSRQAGRAVVWTLVVMLAATGATVWIDAGIAGYLEVPFRPYASFLSPGYALFVAVFDDGRNLGWHLGLQHLCGWLLLGAAAWGSSRLTEKVRQTSRRSVVHCFRGTAETRANRRLRDRRPIQWLAQRNSQLPTILALGVSVFFGAWWTWVAVTEDAQTWRTSITTAAKPVQAVFLFVIIVWMGAESCRCTGAARREGAMELMLATPLPVRDIVCGFWRGLGRVFGPAIGVMLLLSTVGHWFSLAAFSYAYAASAAIALNPSDVVHYQLINWAFSLIDLIALFAAVIAVGVTRQASARQRGRCSGRLFCG